MRIVSKHKDYYDSAMKYGQDDSIVYIRDRKEFLFKYPEQPPIRAELAQIPYISGYSQNKFLVGFCGKLYNGISIQKYGDASATFCYNIDHVESYIRSSRGKEAVQSFSEKRGKKEVSPFDGTRRGYLDYFNPKWRQRASAWEAKQFDEIAKEYNCPAFVLKEEYNNYLLVVNEFLRSVDFIKVMQPHEVYQELSMYLGNIAAPIKEIPKIDNEILREIKGFDEFSFRKPKSS